jgi:hypothetical protein
LGFSTVCCLPYESINELDKLNNIPYFYYGNVHKLLLESDLNIFLNNFDQVSFELIKYLKFDNSCFHRCDPGQHINLILNLKNNNINYYCSFPFSRNEVNSVYYNYLYKYDMYGNEINQY